MRIKSNRIIIRYFERKDSEKLYRIVREKNILRFIILIKNYIKIYFRRFKIY